MPLPVSSLLFRFRTRILPVLIGPPVLAFMPAITLGAFWLWGETALLLLALGLPLVFALGGAFGHGRARAMVPRDRVTGFILRDGFETVIDERFEETAISGLRSACFVLEIGDLRGLNEHHGQGIVDLAMQRSGERIVSVLRDGDTVARLGDGRFAICLIPVRQLDLELCIQLAGRLQTALEEAISLDAITLYLSCSVGFCLRSRAPGETGAAWLSAATAALTDAQRSGPSTVRAYSAEIHRRNRARDDMREDAVRALENGQIQPWYQPQISTDTGKVTGFEALARWHHPVHGLIGPDRFLPILQKAGLIERLGQTMLYSALTALKAWDRAGADVACVGVNFATHELRNPDLVDHIKWELDRFDLSPDRLAVEIVETVVSDEPDEIMIRNIAGLSALGCRIDLDDFGTGHASIASIRRLAVSRIKIDGSFVIKADRDPDQQRMIGAILTMAERLGLETLAEGVETVGEHALLAQLGCNHVQGFGIGRPMPFDQTLDWITSHEAKLADTPRIGRSAG